MENISIFDALKILGINKKINLLSQKEEMEAYHKALSKYNLAQTNLDKNVETVEIAHEILNKYLKEYENKDSLKSFFYCKDEIIAAIQLKIENSKTQDENNIYSQFFIELNFIQGFEELNKIIEKYYSKVNSFNLERFNSRIKFYESYLYCENFSNELLEELNNLKEELIKKAEYEEFDSVEKLQFVSHRLEIKNQQLINEFKNKYSVIIDNIIKKYIDPYIYESYKKELEDVKEKLINKLVHYSNDEEKIESEIQLFEENLKNYVSEYISFKNEKQDKISKLSSSFLESEKENIEFKQDLDNAVEELNNLEDEDEFNKRYDFLYLSLSKKIDSLKIEKEYYRISEALNDKFSKLNIIKKNPYFLLACAEVLYKSLSLLKNFKYNNDIEYMQELEKITFTDFNLDKHLLYRLELILQEKKLEGKNSINEPDETSLVTKK